MEKTKLVLEEVLAERSRQDEKWGTQDHPNGTNNVFKLAADAARCECELSFADGRGTWFDILREEFYEAMAEEDPKNLRTELIQTAAVCVAWVEAIDRKSHGHSY